MNLDTDTVIIGGGQAGLAMAQQLGRRDLDALILDAQEATGDSWRHRWDSLRLFTPARLCGLPDIPFFGDPEHYPTKDEVADYLAAYRATFGLPVLHGQRVTAVDGEPGAFEVTTSTATVTARHVVVATGPFQVPVIPRLEGRVADRVQQLTTVDYRRPDQVPAGANVLVVGGGNSGVQIAEELAATTTVHLASSSRTRHVPQRPLGRDIFELFEAAGYLDIETDSRRARSVQQRQLVIGTSRRTLRRAGVTVRPKVVEISGRRARFEDGSSFYTDVIVWAAGLRSDHTFIQVPGALDRTGQLVQQAGVGAVPGLFTIGMPWQRGRGSALLGRVGVDAALLADELTRLRVTATPQPLVAA